jgi:CRP/FNR family transcriptional regulator, cyclic AMP receptor protein
MPLLLEGVKIMNKKMIERLRKLTIFKNFNTDEVVLNNISKIIHIEHFKQNDYIIKEGEVGNKMYILNKGTVKVEKNTIDGDKFTVVVLNDKMNIFFGELALMDDDTRSASIKADTETECYVINKMDFENFCEENPRIGYYITKEMIRSLAGNLRKTTTDKLFLIEAFISEDND